ncbi:MAG: hypothetical protein SVO01_10060 [Thermotogota bacterium]|nr:hypothetical protein [Thermotogota bacterium]
MIVLMANNKQRCCDCPFKSEAVFKEKFPPAEKKLLEEKLEKPEPEELELVEKEASTTLFPLEKEEEPIFFDTKLDKIVKEQKEAARIKKLCHNNIQNRNMKAFHREVDTFHRMNLPQNNQE